MMLILSKLSKTASKKKDNIDVSKVQSQVEYEYREKNYD